MKTRKCCRYESLPQMSRAVRVPSTPVRRECGRHGRPPCPPWSPISELTLARVEASVAKLRPQRGRIWMQPTTMPWRPSYNWWSTRAKELRPRCSMDIYRCAFTTPNMEYLGGNLFQRWSNCQLFSQREPSGIEKWEGLLQPSYQQKHWGWWRD